MSSLAFGTSQLEVLFALRYAEQGRKPAAAAAAFTTAASLLVLARCIAIAAGDALRPRIAILIVLASIATGSHAWALVEILRRSQVWRHESVKSTAALVGATVCMMAAILSHQHELGLKAPVFITGLRGFLVLAETYRLSTALRLHAVHMVCFACQELDLFLQPSRHSLSKFCADLATALLIGKAIPIAMAAVIEARSRAAFLNERRLPMTHLRPFWQRVLGLTGANGPGAAEKP